MVKLVDSLVSYFEDSIVIGKSVVAGSTSLLEAAGALSGVAGAVIEIPFAASELEHLMSLKDHSESAARAGLSARDLPPGELSARLRLTRNLGRVLAAVSTAIDAIMLVQKISNTITAVAESHDRLLRDAWSYQHAHARAMARSSGVGQVTCDDDRGDKEDDGNGRNLASITPEDKFGPDGYDPPGTEPGLEQRFITPGQVMEYRVDFWNREDAEVPTQDAVIYDYLDPALFDFSTFEFTRVGFLAWDMPLPGGQSIDVRIDARPEMNISVDVTASFDPETGRIEWWFHGVDPLTGDYPEDPMVGFLPPFNPLTQFELGWVEFRVQAWDDLATGTRIENQAFVQFDFLGPWGPAPKDGPWVNTIDAGPPTSNVLPLPATAITRLFPVAWQGIDDAGGSGVAHYDVYVSAEGGPYELWQESTTDTSGHYLGQPGRTYRFYAVATDNVGHRQPTPAAAQATTTVSLLSPWHNTSLRGDVNRDGLVTLGDALLVVQGLRDNGIGYEHLGVPGATDPLLDVNGDWIASLSDVLEVINILRAQRDADPEPEGEAFGVAPAVPESPFAIWSITGRRAWASSLLPERDEENELSATASVDGWRGDDATAGVLALATSAHQPAFQAGDESAAGRDVDWRWEDLPLDEIVADLTLSATAGDRPVPNSDHGQEWRG